MACLWRKYDQNNQSVIHAWIYGIEMYLHEQLLLSEHRTMDPEEADFFYVPVRGGVGGALGGG